ncbi:MAG: hypothetical protein A3C97_02155 [Candidatus Levybacteria bacterium RIFCSPHIGHO2_02_FULL_37_11]|nr:MAG: hypothetical protein A3C97_02155 [Candidatus Levybacteria bacterium RIFCSPHIGHO2_02_FULL_37_11]
MGRKKKDQGKSTRIGIYFFVFILGVVLISLLFKGLLIVKNSKFQDDSRFNFLISNNKTNKIISFLPQNHSVSVLKVEGKVENINKLLEVPIDGEVRSSSLDLEKPVSSIVSDVFFGFKNIKTNFTVLDLFRIFLFTKTASPGNFTKNVSANLDEAALDKISSLLFSDPKIADENLSVGIINATEEYGVGNRLARLISNISGNVVLVSTSPRQEDKSVILYSGRKTHTIERLGKLLGFEVMENKSQGLADVTIRIGKDYKNLSSF